MFMKIMRIPLLIACAALTLNAHAIPIAGNTAPGAPVSLGFLTAGDYDITATGIVSLAGPVGGTPNFDLDPDGIPVTGVTFPTYLYFNPTGSDTADGFPGQAGAGINVGALVGTFNASPTLASDWFLLGSSTTLSLLTDQTLYAAVNDTFAPNNEGAFDVTITRLQQPPTPTPAPATLALMGVCLAGLGWKRRKIK